MKGIFKILALLLVAALTATATGYALGADIGYQPPAVVQTVGLEPEFYSPLPPSQRGRGFDRYATVLTGPVINFSPLYAFVQVGAVYNPSTEYKIGIAANTGAGVAFDIGRLSRIFAEASVDAVPTGGKWESTFSACVGYAVRI